MKKYILALIMSLFALECRAITIFACEPEWASLVEEIGKDKVSIFTATTAFQDAHYVQARPSLIANMRKADLVICSGAGLESGWLPVLYQKTGGGKKSIMAADYIVTLDKPVKIDRSEGDVHPEGNPHLHLNPHNLLKVSDVVVKEIVMLDSANKDFYEKNHADFKTKFSAAIKTWEKQAESLKGSKVLSQHKNLTYLFDWLKIENVGTLEPKPGIPPTSKHLNELINVTKAQNVKLILHTPFENSKSAKWLSDKTGVRYVELPYTTSGSKKNKDLYGLFYETISLMLMEDK